MSAQLTTLEEWGKSKFGEKSPNLDTLRRWAREGKIFPTPKKCGRAYFVNSHAEYVDNYNDSDFLRRVRESA